MNNRFLNSVDVQRKCRSFVWRVVMLLLLSFFAAQSTATPAVEEVLALLGISTAQIATLYRGDIIAEKTGEATAKELAMNVAMYISAPPSKVISYFNNVNLSSIDPKITAYEDIPLHAGADAFKTLALSLAQSTEAEDLLTAEPGSDFNLSAEEIAKFAQLKEKLSLRDRTALVNGVSQAYQEILWRRWQAYRKQGLEGIAAYARDGGKADPAAELHIAAKNTKVLQRYFPNLYKVWLNYPAALPAGATERFYWLNRKVEGRPTATLDHMIMQTVDSGAIIVLRQFYVGHTYNSSQMVVGCLPYREGTIVFYAQKASTDQVAGVGSDLKRNIGRERIKEQMISRLERLRSAIRSF